MRPMSTPPHRPTATDPPTQAARAPRRASRALALGGVAAMLGAAALVISAAGCETDVAYKPCAYTPQMQRLCCNADASPEVLRECQANDRQDKVSCVVDDHPECEERICVSHRGSTSFCTARCEVDAECPRGGFCATQLVEDRIERYCVAPELR